MTTRERRLVATGVALILAGLTRASGAAAPPGHPAFDLLKSLAGDWKGPAVWDRGGNKGNVEFEVSYRVTSGGTAVVETMFAGTPGEMLTVYHVEEGNVVLTHFCTAGNQPRMKLQPSDDPNVLAFACAGGANMKEADSHMHSARITVLDPNHLKGEWSSVKAGKVEWVAEGRLERSGKEPASSRVSGTFDVKLTPQPAADEADEVPARTTAEKRYHGDLEGTGRGEMLSAMTAVKGSGVYVAVERFTGSLRGRKGSFLLHHTGVMTRGEPHLTIAVVPDSGTGELAGITGTMAIVIAEGGKHSYELEYTLPPAAAAPER